MKPGFGGKEQTEPGYRKPEGKILNQKVFVLATRNQIFIYHFKPKSKTETKLPGAEAKLKNNK